MGWWNKGHIKLKVMQQAVQKQRGKNQPTLRVLRAASFYIMAPPSFLAHFGIGWWKTKKENRRGNMERPNKVQKEHIELSGAFPGTA